MALISKSLLITSLVLVSILAINPNSCNAFKFKSLNYSDDNGGGLQWGSASATWYGAPTGAGPDDNGGGCGFKNVNLPPFNSLISCGNAAIFRGGKGCGSCYQVKCTGHPACSGNPSTITITDECLYGVCSDAEHHFDMSGTTFGSMAIAGREDELRHAGRMAILFARVPCNYPGLTVSFHVEEGSNPMYLAILVEYADGDGDLSQVDVLEGTQGATWTPLRQSWGAIWRLDSSHPLQGPFSVRITTLTSGKTLVAQNVIPADYVPNYTYRSVVQFNS
ncbi:hypothetical protein LUZ60_002491 [Juncus effusus]|nr:hypothetical protein LUZ60_002491 [Juncus effusus]